MLKNIISWFGVNWLSLVAIFAVFGALFNSEFPYAYFQIMNWIVVAAAILVALRVHNVAVMWLFISIAILFNPIAPIFLRADIWQIADVIVIFIFIISLFIKSEDK